ncbi:MAG: NAD(P)H-dependent oxidoreductase [Burkholderiaceae bacterium]
MADVLIIDGHPDGDSLCAALAASHAEGLRAGGAQVDVLALRSLRFDPVLHAGYLQTQVLEPDLQQAQQSMLASRRIVVVTPVWWGSVPALLKGFLDRTLERGWAFRYHANGMPEGLLAGRSARLIVTTDSPGFYLRFIQGDPTVKALVRSTLRFCGLKPVDVTRIGPVKTSGGAQRQRWLDAVKLQGQADARRLPPAGHGVPVRPILPSEAASRQ